MNILSIILLCCLLLAGYIATVQYSKANKLQSIADTLAANMNSISKVIEDADEMMESVTLRKAFENDDEVGTFFKQLKDIQDVLSQFKLQDEKKEQ